MVWPGLTKPIKLGLQDRKDKDNFETDVKHSHGDERTRFPGMNVRGWSGRAWPGKHVGPPQTYNGGLFNFIFYLGVGLEDLCEYFLQLFLLNEC